MKNLINNPYYYKIYAFLKKRPQTMEEAQKQVAKIFPKSGMKIYWHKREIGLYRWRGLIYNPILKKKISDGDSNGYELAHDLLSWVFNRGWGGGGGIAGNVYGCMDGGIISKKQEKIIKKWEQNRELSSLR